MDYIYEAKRILSGCLFVPIEKISEDSDVGSFQEIDSVNFALIIVEIEEFIKGEVDPVELLELRTVKDLAAILERSEKCSI